MKLLSSKIFAGYLSVILVLTGLILFFSYQTIRQDYINNYINYLKNLNITLHNQIIEHIGTDSHDQLDLYIKKIGKRINTRITVVDTLGKVVADSDKDPKLMENHLARPEIQAALKHNIGTSTRFSQSLNQEMLYVAIPVIKDNRNLCMIRVSLYLSEIDEITDNLTYEIIRSALIVMILSLIGSLFFSKNISKPLKSLSLASGKVASGNFDVKVNTNRRDEIEELADNFNNMTGKLKSLFSEVNRKKDELNTIISTLQEGLVVLDNEGRIILCNQGFENLIGKTDLIGKLYWQLIEDYQFLSDMFYKIVQTKNSFSIEIEFNKASYLCSANYIESKREAVFLFHDISEFKKLEKIKKDFVVNVSHELRTPLTAIKGFVETLEDELEGEHERYMEIIKRHTDRLINIVQDLLILAELEETNFSLLLTQADLNLLIENVVKIFIPKAKEKEIDINLDFKINPSVRLDAFRIEQVFVNLIDNAIKYTDKGFVNIKVDKNETHAIISIQDSGVGISKEDMERIFERFYIVDKSRSRRVGGTGLGLSIVKHIIQLHNGEIKLESQLGKGTKFVIHLPLSI